MNQPVPNNFDEAPFPYGIVHAIYATTLVAASFGMFGANGFVPAVVALGIWALVFSGGSRPRTLLLIVLPLSVVTCCLLLPDLRTPRAASDRMYCSNNLKQIAMALHGYHDQYKSFPPAYVADENGTPMHSWRVLILPFFELSAVHSPASYSQYDFDKPWDGPSNSQLAAQMPRVYACPSLGPRDGGSMTNYLAVVDPHSAWPGTRATGFRDILDGMSNTLLVLENDSRSVNWMEPRDVSYEEAMSLLTEPSGSNSPHRFENFFQVHYVGRQIALVDGSVRFVRRGVPAEMANALLLRDDGGSPAGYDRLLAQSRLRIDNCIRVAVFILLALWPLPWVWIHPRGTTPTSPAEPSQSQ